MLRSLLTTQPAWCGPHITNEPKRGDCERLSYIRWYRKANRGPSFGRCSLA